MLKRYTRRGKHSDMAPAAFRRLCVETCPPATWRTPPEPAAFRRLCVETVAIMSLPAMAEPAAFRRLCVETRYFVSFLAAIVPAAFRRLCVETKIHGYQERRNGPAAFRRLCVETMNTRSDLDGSNFQPPSGGCVLKHNRQPTDCASCSSRLQAAVC